jgi:hypothetical protein
MALADIIIDHEIPGLMGRTAPVTINIESFNDNIILDIKGGDKRTYNFRKSTGDLDSIVVKGNSYKIRGPNDYLEYTDPLFGGFSKPADTEMMRNIITTGYDLAVFIQYQFKATPKAFRDMWTLTDIRIIDSRRDAFFMLHGIETERPKDPRERR